MATARGSGVVACDGSRVAGGEYCFNSSQVKGQNTRLDTAPSSVFFPGLQIPNSKIKSDR